MTTEPPKVKENGRYPIGEAARLLGVNRKTLWSKTLRSVRDGGIAFSTPKGSTKKFFSGRDILAYWRRCTGC